MFRREKVRFLETTDLSELRASLRIKGKTVSEFQKTVLEYLEKNIKTGPAYHQSEIENRFSIREPTKDLISLIDWDDKNLNTNTSHGIINSRIKGNYLIIEVQGNHDFVKHFYEFVNP